MRIFCVGAAALLCCLLTSEKAYSQTQHARRTPIVEAVAKARPSIVTIKAVRRAGGRESIGTGVIVDDRGYILTCNHVIAHAAQLKLRLTDGTEHEPHVVLTDPQHDLAILHVAAGKPLPALPLGPSGDLLIGETVIAVGHPYGYSHTVSTGILSAVDREITLPEGVVLADLIQTNASINPGNSGGPLLNINGEWIGVTLAMREGAQGIAFALKTDTVQRVLGKHLSALKMAGLHHGLTCQESISENNAPRQQVKVKEVSSQSPAAQAGLRQGDTVLCVANRPVANRFDVERAFWHRTAGEKIELVVLRQEKELRLTLTLSRAAQTVRGTVAPEKSPID